MSERRRRRALAIAVVAGGLLTTGCGVVDARDEAPYATLWLELSPGAPNFNGHSVRIIGRRAVGADTKYPCLSAFDSCVPFDAAGWAGLDQLCPSHQVPWSNWTFDYRLYTDTACGQLGGYLLNAPGNPNDFVCYDSTDIFERSSPNQTVGEILLPGVNENVVVCLTTNSLCGTTYPVTITTNSGNVTINPGNVIQAGFAVMMPGAHPATTIEVSGAVTINLSCPGGNTSSLVVPIPRTLYAIPQNNGTWFPSANAADPLTFQGQITAPATLCGGQPAQSTSATFNTQVAATTSSTIHMRFHYRNQTLNTGGGWSNVAVFTAPCPP